MSGLILAINAGSSSVKFAVHEAGGELRRIDGGKLEDIGGERYPDHEAALQWLLQRLESQGETRQLLAAGHRVVHGGLNFRKPITVDDNIRAALAELIPLAPLHQAHNLAAMEALARLRPGLPQVACFDTAFHRTQPELAQRYALPREITEQGVRAYGFHGLSYEYIARQLPEVCGELPAKVIVLHLGNGASLCALQDGKSMATTMGLTPLDGIPMGTRPGHLDPGVLLYLQQQLGMSIEEVESMLYHHSGLLGVSGISSDMRSLLESHAPAAKEAIDLFVYQVGRAIGSLAAALGGVDALVFTGGIGERSPTIRAAIAQRAQWLGLELDNTANTAGHTQIHTAESKLTAWVIPTDEEWMIVRHTWATLTT